MVKKSLFSAVLILILSALFATAWADRQPNVIVILADDLGFSDLGCYGGEIPTPNLDKIASSGVRFTSFGTSARCCPSRASMITGLHPHQAGIGSFATREPKANASRAYTGHLLDNCVTLAEILGDAGYSTWMVGKWHMGIPGPMERGFQNYYGYRNFLAYAEDQWQPQHYVRLPEGTHPELEYEADEFYVTDVFTDYALEFLSQARKIDKPYFLYLAHSSPHFPVQAPKESIDRHFKTYQKGWDVLRAERLEQQKKIGLMKVDAPLPPRSMVPVDREDIANGFPGQPNPAWDSLPKNRQNDLARRMATFAAMVEHVDQGVGKIIEDLEKHDELDNTLIFFLSDNGACYEWGPFGFDGPSRRGITKLHTGKELDQVGQPGTHHSYGSGWANLCNTPLNMYKHFCHEGGICSPLIIAWPDKINKSGAWIKDPAHLMDIVPTVLDATGLDYPKTRNGQKITPTEGLSLLKPINGQSLPERALCFEHQGARGLRRGKWKIVWGKRQPTEVTWELYDMENDRSEQHNLAAEKPELLAELVAEWESWAKRVGVQGFEERTIAKSEDVPQVESKPNFVFIIADDCTFRDIGCYGGQAHTPNIDRLAEEGMRMSQCFQAAPMCSPTRHNIYTGLYPVKSGAYPNHTFAKEGTQSIVHYLKPLGYRVALSGKTHIKPTEVFPFEYSKKENNPDMNVIDTLFGECVESKTPFCLFACSNEPHTPWNKGDPSRYDADKLKLPPYIPDTPYVRQQLSKYFAEITYYDDQVGQILDLLDKHKLADNTLVMVVSEQGNSLPFAKWTCYEDGLGSIMIVRWPGKVKAGRVSDALVEYVDVTPTFVEAAGGKPAEVLEGKSMLPVLLGKTDTHKQYTYGIMTTRGIINGSESYPIRSVRDLQYRLIWNLQPEVTFHNACTRGKEFQSMLQAAAAGDQHAKKFTHRYQYRPEFELYDVVKDPHNIHNLADDPKYKKTVKKLKAKLDAWMAQQGDLGIPTEMDAMNHQGNPDKKVNEES